MSVFEAYYHYVSIEDFDSSAELIVSKRKNEWGLEESLGEAFCRLGLLNQIIYAIQLIVDKLSSSPSLGEIYTILGDALFLTGEISNAMSSYQISQRTVRSLLGSKDTSKDISNRNQLLHLEANASLSIGLCYLETWEIQNATTIFQRGIEKGLVSTKTFFSFLFCQAYALSCINETSTQVEKLLNRASDLFEDTNSRQSLNSWNIGYYYFYAGEAYKNIGKIDLSVSMLNKAINYGKETNYIQLKSKALFGLAKVQRGNKNYSVSLEYQMEAIEIL